MTRARDRLVGVAGLAALIVLHVDFWRPQRAIVYFGWMPEEILYRLGWMLAAFLYLTFVVARLWEEDPA